MALDPSSNRLLAGRFLRLAKPYWVSTARKTALGHLAVLLLLLLAVNGLNVVINFVAGAFMTALQGKDQPVFYRMLWIYFGVFVVGTPITVFYSYMQDRLGMKWRQWLTTHVLEKYFANRKYYHINQEAKLDNPDERIAQDVDAFCKSALSFTLILLGSIITFCSFITILWEISKPLVLIVLAYSTAGTLATFFIGRRLIGLNFSQLKKEADFRYGLIHVRNHTESIAFYRGEEREKAQVQRRFGEAIWNFNLLIGWTRNLGFVTTGYSYMIVLIPALIIAPLYFAGKAEFGEFTQADMAFGQILTAVSLVVTSFTDLSNFAAVVQRLSGFVDELDAPERTGTPDAEVIATVPGEAVALDHVTLMTPTYERTLVKDLSVAIPPGTGLLIVGPSGSGKSSLLRGIAGLWSSGGGTIQRPDLGDLMFLPQRPYMILGSLRAQLLYPQNRTDVTDDALRAVLSEVNLADLPDRVGGFDRELNFADVLSLGEQQRLAFARLLLAQPRYAILDEATSALDATNEEHLYGLLLRSSTTIISVGHRPSLVKFHPQVLERHGDTGWRVMTKDEYASKG